MAGVHFLYEDFKKLLDLTIGLAERLDENRAESFTLLYCDFSKVLADVIQDSLHDILRNSDSIVNLGSDYFFVLPYTDKYGAGIVKKMFEEFFTEELNTAMVAYPRDGESSKMLLEELRNISLNDLKCLDRFITY
ncbi:MAG: hypothetical protein QG559_270 [Campylobacterota bacterium]|nr:hypothetical protein [Campylobacterota bacterium]